MAEENPYRYEGSANSLQKPRARGPKPKLPSERAMFLAGLFGAFLPALYIPLFMNLYAILITFPMMLLTLIPIGIFVRDLGRKKNRLIAMISCWSAAVIVAFCLSLSVTYLGGELTTVMYFLILFGSQVLGVSIALLLITWAKFTSRF